MIEIRPLRDTNIEALRGLTGHASIAGEFDVVQEDGALEAKLAIPFAPPGLRWLALADGEPAGFAFSFILPSWDGMWSNVRFGVLERHRRRGIATRLVETSTAAIRERHPECGEIVIAAWMPNAAAQGFAERHGFHHARNFWLMDRPLGGSPAVEWPNGIEVRIFDGGDRGLQDWNDTYNRAFARHYHGVISTLENCRALMARPKARPDGLLLAYRNGRCVGFCRNDLYPERGEIGVLGVDPEARGIGLGRALLRWGVDWLERERAPRVTLLVDGENENALGLYRSEGFAITRTRSYWGRPAA